MIKKEFSLDFHGRTMTATFSDLADQANGAVMMRYGDTIVLVTAVMGQTDKAGIDYFPLSVDYEEKFYAAGKIMGSRFIKRENRPSDEAVLSGRVIDRTIRPLFDQDMRREVQVVAAVLSIDDLNDPDALSVIGASLAIGTSDIPWGGPVSAVKIGLGSIEESFIVNPVHTEKRPFDILVCGKDGNVNMVEADSREMSEEKFGEAIGLAVIEIEKIQEWQKGIIKEIGKTKARVTIAEMPEGAKELFAKEIEDELLPSMQEGKSGLARIMDKWTELFGTTYPDAKTGPAGIYIEERMDEVLHHFALDEDKRVDGRAFNEIRKLEVMAGGISNIIHGSGTFYRGGTHVFSALTLGGPDDSQLIEGMEISGKK